MRIILLWIKPIIIGGCTGVYDLQKFRLNINSLCIYNYYDLWWWNSDLILQTYAYVWLPAYYGL